MRSPPTHDFRLSREYQFPQQATALIAIVDLDSYPPFLLEPADRFDLLQHLCGQTEALTATMWEVPTGPLQLQVIWAANDWTGERLKQTGHRGVADGYVRTDGHLCLMADDQLFAGRRRRRDPRHGRGSVAGQPQPHVLLVPPGIYAVGVFTGLASESGASKSSTVGYTVVLRHHPHPAPRLQPVRLGGLTATEFPAGSGETISSHARDYNFS